MHLEKEFDVNIKRWHSIGLRYEDTDEIMLVSCIIPDALLD